MANSVAAPLQGTRTDVQSAREANAAGGTQSKHGHHHEAVVAKIRRRDGSETGFSPMRLRQEIDRVMRDSGVNDEKQIGKVASQVLSRLGRRFAGSVPTVDDVAHIVAMTLIDNNVGFAVKRYFENLLPNNRENDRLSFGSGLKFRRFYTREGVHPFDEVEWENRDAVIRDSKGKAVFEQLGVEMPKDWSQSATNIAVSKYFRGEIGKPDRETSARQLVGRVAKTISDWGRKDGYFSAPADADTFEHELTYLLINQHAAFNSPVWFNVGVSPRPQCSACFINSVTDDMRSILNLTVTEGMLFKYGSGTGTNLSSLRSSKEKLANSSGKSSGPVSFMRGFDAFAGVIKSGGKTRRAAKMVMLDIDHPDIVDFIECKVKEERKAKALMAAGYDGSIEGDAYSSIFFQNANNSVRVNDTFMQALQAGATYDTKAVTTGETVETLSASEVMGKLASAAWECGDPGMQYDTTINRWNPVKNSGQINGSNPCSEYMFLDDSACNLASLNLMKFRGPDGDFDVDAFSHAVDVILTAQEIIVANSSYPTPAIEANSHDFRPLGIGYANLGALLMSRGLAYDSDEGRNFAAAITSLMTGRAYRQSAVMAEAAGPFRFYDENREPFMEVIGMHREAAYSVPANGVPQNLYSAARRSWDEARLLGESHGYRNAQVSLLAPTGTIGFLMDCDTTGIEPDIALVKYKWLVGGGMMKIVNNTVPEALYRLGYTTEERHAIMDWIDANDTIEGAPHLKEEHLPVFDCAFRPSKGKRSIHYTGHLRMMAAVQPFLSGAISKTVNLPTEATVKDVADAYTLGWELGLKAVAIYRDGSKGQQVLTTSKDDSGNKKEQTKEEATPMVATEKKEEPKAEHRDIPTVKVVEARADAHRPMRRRLPDERRSLTHKFSIAGHEGYITVGLYDDGTPGELFIRMAKGGTVVAGLIDAFATSTSIALQYGVPLRVLCTKFVHLRFEPSGFTTNPHIRIAKSIMDYIFRYLAYKFLPIADQMALGVNVDVQTLAERGQDDVDASVMAGEERVNGSDSPVCVTPPEDQLKLEDAPEYEGNENLTATFAAQSDAPVCDTCGSLMVRNGACYKCLNCGSTSGCS